LERGAKRLRSSDAYNELAHCAERC
jgi:hypothetical protein